MATSLNSSSNAPLDSWDHQTSPKPIARKTTKPPAVRDDWEDDDEDEIDSDGDVEELKAASSTRPSPPNRVRIPPEDEDDAKKIWETANTRVGVPMPTLLSSRTGSIAPPPAAAFQPAMRILKRPQSSSPSQGSPTTSPPPTGESLQEREARYAAARERIFGSESSERDVASPKPPNNVKIVREPKGPESALGMQAQSSGFRGRGGKTASSPRPPSS